MVKRSSISKIIYMLYLPVVQWQVIENITLIIITLLTVFVALIPAIVKKRVVVFLLFRTWKVNQLILDKSIKLWIHNKLPSSYYGKPLCLSYQKEGQSALLKECRLDEGQKWIISDSHAGRIVSFSATEDEIKTMKCDSTQTLF